MSWPPPLLAMPTLFVTFNTKDFPQAVLQPYGIEVQHPDEFLMNQLQLQKIPALSAIKKMRARWTNPERPALALITAFPKRGLLLMSDLLHDAMDLIFRYKYSENAMTTSASSS